MSAMGQVRTLLPAMNMVCSEGESGRHGRGLLVWVPFSLAPAVQTIGVLGRWARQVPAHYLGCQPQGQNQKAQAKQVRHARDGIQKRDLPHPLRFFT